MHYLEERSVPQFLVSLQFIATSRCACLWSSDPEELGSMIETGSKLLSLNSHVPPGRNINYVKLSSCAPCEGCSRKCVYLLCGYVYVFLSVCEGMEANHRQLYKPFQNKVFIHKGLSSDFKSVCVLVWDVLTKAVNIASCISDCRDLGVN